MPTIASFDYVLLDSSPVVNFCDAGHHARLVDYLWRNGYITTFVQDELSGRLSAGHPNVSAFLEAWPNDGVLEPNTDESIEINRLLRLGTHAHPLEDAGEISTVIVAANYSEPESVVVIDDNWGRSFAKQWGVPCGITGDLVAEMVWAHYLTENEGREVWHCAYSKPEVRAAYDDRLALAMDKLGDRPEPPAT